MKIYLIGFSCAGKTTIGPLLSHKLNYSFYDLDDMISKKQNKSIADIFKNEGEQEFRKYESEILAELSELKESFCTALGGGAFQSPKNQDMIYHHHQINKNHIHQLYLLDKEKLYSSNYS